MPRSKQALKYFHKQMICDKVESLPNPNTAPMKKQAPLLRASIGLMTFCSGAYAQFIPGGVDSAGLSYLVPDTLVWYNTNQLPGNIFPGYVTNGPIHNLN